MTSRPAADPIAHALENQFGLADRVVSEMIDTAAAAFPRTAPINQETPFFRARTPGGPVLLVTPRRRPPTGGRDTHTRYPRYVEGSAGVCANAVKTPNITSRRRTMLIQVHHGTEPNRDCVSINANIGVFA